jgi:hypothetical protein
MLLTVWEDFETAAERLYLQDPMKVKRNLSLSFAQPNVGLKLIILSSYYSLQGRSEGRAQGAVARGAA